MSAALAIPRDLYLAWDKAPLDSGHFRLSLENSQFGRDLGCGVKFDHEFILNPVAIGRRNACVGDLHHSEGCVRVIVYNPRFSFFRRIPVAIREIETNFVGSGLKIYLIDGKSAVFQNRYFLQKLTAHLHLRGGAVYFHEQKSVA